MADLIVPATKEQMASIQLYADLLGEAKIRIGIINHFITGKPSCPDRLLGSPHSSNYACSASLSRLAASWRMAISRAERSLGKNGPPIGSLLENLHQDFYPLPLDKGENLQFSPTKDDYLTKEDLISLNHYSGDVLHRGTLKKLLTNRDPIQVHFPEILT